jgi:hypothetical protein
MWDLLALAVSPSFVVGIVLGVVLAVVFHYIAPVGVDTAAAGAWFVGIGGAVGLLWRLIFGSRKE